MYHDVVDAGAEDTSGFPGRDAALYKIGPELFAEHLDAIATFASFVPSVSDPPDPPGPVFTFDDGGVSAMRAAELLDERGLAGYFLVTTNYIGTRGFVTERNIRDLARRGHTIGSHSCSHPLRMGRCSWTQLTEEWTCSRARLGGILGTEIRVASIPGGDLTPQVAEAAARAGITTLFTSEPTRERRHAFGLTLVGRYTIQKWTDRATAGALAAGDWLPCARQVVIWNAKKVSKRLGGARYLQIRRMLLGHDAEVRWGDQS